MNSIAIGGIPAAGKSSLMRSFMRSCAQEHGAAWRPFTYGTITGHRLASIWILGTYDDGLFDGTDRLSMSCQQHFRFLLGGLADTDAVVLWEGNRLFKASLIAFAHGRSRHHSTIILTADEPVIGRRHHERRDSQTPRILRARSTELTNTLKKLTTDANDAATDPDIMLWSNNTPEDLQMNTERLLAMAR